MAIPFLDVQKAYLELKQEIDQCIERVLASGIYVLGNEVAQFESEYARYCGAAEAIGVGNGFDALLLALRAAEIGPGHEVLVPTNTFIATWLAVTHSGATPIPVEIDLRTQHIDTDLIAAAITPKTRAIIPVHLFGNPVNLAPLHELARRHQLLVIEDAAQAHGAHYRGTRIGGHSDLVCWSFYPGKNLGALGDGGAITTNNSELALKIRKLRNYGASRKYHHEFAGVNSRLDEIQAAILRTKLPRLDEWNRRRKDIAALYLSGLANTTLTLPQSTEDADSVWHLFVIRHKQRDRLAELLARSGIETIIHYPTPPTAQPAYSAGFKAPLADSPSRICANENLSLPIGPHLGMEAARQVVAATVSALETLEGATIEMQTIG